jgi:chromosomal replication initiation ATPase DnaA
MKPGPRTRTGSLSETERTQICNSIVARHDVPLCRVRSQSKRPVLVRARQAVWVALLDSGMSLAAAGQWTGGHHHTTVLHGSRKARAS